jgi:hypothetical protein
LAALEEKEGLKVDGKWDKPAAADVHSVCLIRCEAVLISIGMQVVATGRASSVESKFFGVEYPLKGLSGRGSSGISSSWAMHNEVFVSNSHHGTVGWCESPLRVPELCSDIGSMWW